MREIVLISAFVHLVWIHEMFEPGLQAGGFLLLGDIVKLFLGIRSSDLLVRKSEIGEGLGEEELY